MTKLSERYRVRYIFSQSSPPTSARPRHWCREKRNKHDQKRPFITKFSAKDIRILRAAYRAIHIQTSAGERPPLSPKLDHLPKIAAVSEWPCRLGDNRSVLWDRSRIDGGTEKATPARLGCNHPMARGTTGSRRATVPKAKDPPEQNSVCKEGSFHILDQKASTRDNRRYICAVWVHTTRSGTEADQSFPGTAIRSDRGSGKFSGCVGLSYAPVRRQLLAALPSRCSSQ